MSELAATAERRFYDAAIARLDARMDGHETLCDERAKTAETYRKQMVASVDEIRTVLKRVFWSILSGVLLILGFLLKIVLHLPS